MPLADEDEVAGAEGEEEDEEEEEELAGLLPYCPKVEGIRRNSKRNMVEGGNFILGAEKVLEAVALRTKGEGKSDEKA